jgi:hypothetical protein
LEKLKQKSLESPFVPKLLDLEKLR